MKKKNPKFTKTGEVYSCAECPLEKHGILCGKYLAAHNVQCPTRDNYAEVAAQAEESPE